jgi:hypothetical protein
MSLFVLMNVYDLASYLAQDLAVQTAAQTAVQAIRSTCGDVGLIPATTHCPALNSAVTTAIQSTAYGNQITLVGASSEGFYCVNSSNALQYVSNVSNEPSNCNSAGSPTLGPGDYVEVQSQSRHAPLFGRALVASLLPSPITASAWTRLQ